MIIFSQPLTCVPIDVEPTKAIEWFLEPYKPLTLNTSDSKTDRKCGKCNLCDKNQQQKDKADPAEWQLGMDLTGVQSTVTHSYIYLCTHSRTQSVSTNQHNEIVLHE